MVKKCLCLLLLIIGLAYGHSWPAWGANRGPIQSGETRVNMIISGPPYWDTYTFEGNADEGVIINAVTTSGALDTAIDLWAPDGTLEVRGWQTGYGGDVLEWRLRQTGLYTIVIKDYGLNDSGTYHITFLKIPGAVTSLGDLDGGAIDPGETLNPGGTINGASDIDAFQFYGNKNDHVSINAVAISGGLDTAIDLFAPDGSLEARGWQTGYGGDSLEHDLAQTGLYTIIVKDYGLDNAGQFWISTLKIPAELRPGAYNPSPPNGGIITNSNGSFSWDPVEGATGYDLYFGRNVVEPLEKIGDDLPLPQMPSPQMDIGKVYYWHVVAHSENGDIEGPYWSFLVGTQPLPDIDVQPPSWDYGNVNVGSTSDKSFTVHNIGTATLNVSGTTMVGLDAGQFAILSGGGTFSLAPGASRTVTVQFRPTSPGPKDDATLRFTSDDPDENPKDVPLQGAGFDTVTILNAVFFNRLSLLLVSATSSAAPEAELSLTVAGCVSDAPMRLLGNKYVYWTAACSGLDGQTATITSSFGGADSDTIR